MSIAHDHPVAFLLAFVDDELNDGVVRGFRRAVESVTTERTWVLGPPIFVDSVDEAGRTSVLDEAIRTVGCQLSLYSAMAPWGDQLPWEVDARHLEEVKALVSSLSAVSHDFNIDIGFELDDDSVGHILHGEPDELLTDALLGEWERTLERKRLAEG